MIFSLWKFTNFIAATRTFFETNTMQDWTLEISKKWDVLGPFPIQAREQHYLSPSFPLDLSVPYHHEPDRKWFSSLADGGQVGWTRFISTDDGSLRVSFPHVRWSTLRATEGWAALQHHSVLRTTLTVIPPRNPPSSPPRLAFSLLRGSFFTLIPATSSFTNTSFTPEWNLGNIYALPRPPKQIIDLPSLSPTEPTLYHLFVSGDYEIRLFGDPVVTGHEGPVLDITLDVTLESRQTNIDLEPFLDVTCDFVDGWAFGSALGVGVHAIDGSWDVLDVKSSTPIFKLSLLHKQRLAPSQTRVIPVSFEQIQPFHGEAMQLSISLFNPVDSRYVMLTTSLKIQHRSHWNETNYPSLRATYFLASTPTPFRAVPPLEPNLGFPKPPILALRKIAQSISLTPGLTAAQMAPVWTSRILSGPPLFRANFIHGLFVLLGARHGYAPSPSPLTFKGLHAMQGFDWRGPSADDAWGSLDGLTDLLATKPQWETWGIHEHTRVIVIGHSNGGQGTWYLATRYPDRVLAAVPAAAYIKSQQYIPLSLSRGSHFIDPSLRAILESSLTPDDNDLFLSNVVNMAILAIHGGKDENVPTWHSRELVGLAKSWCHGANVSFIEEPGKPHWYSEVLNSSQVRSFLSSVLEDTSPRSVHPGSFTLTVATPGDSGSLHGFAISELETPGRLARLHVTEIGDSATVKTTNVHTFSIELSARRRLLVVDDVEIPLSEFQVSTIWIQRGGESWKTSSHSPQIRAVGPLSQILRSPSPLLIVIPTNDRHAQSIATRVAHAMLLYFRLDTEIIKDTEALSKSDPELRQSDIIVVGLHNAFANRVMGYGPGVVKPHQNGFIVHGKRFEEPSLGLLFLHPHPSAPGRIVLFLGGTDTSGLERATRLFLPVRTGVALPELLILGNGADSFGAGGLRGAGFWNRTWGWSEAMAWVD